jgi:hypothetical protein
MSNWIYGKDLIGHWDIEDFELFGFLKKGLQPYDKHGRKVIDSDSLEWGRKWTPEHCENLVRGTQTGIVMTNSGPLVSPRLTEQEIKQEGKEFFESLPLKILNPPKDSPYMSFSLPFNEKEATKAIASAKYFKFKKDEASEFAEKHDLPRLDQGKSDHTSAEEPNKKEAVETSPEKSDNPEATKLFPCKEGTKWEDVKITLIASDTVRIETPNGKGRYTYHELGMADKRPGDKPKEVWETLKLFASNQGIFPQENQKVNEKNLVEKAKHLNAHLKKLFGIKERIYKHFYKKLRRYETKIKFSDQTIAHVPDPSQDKSPFDSELDEINKKIGILKESV